MSLTLGYFKTRTGDAARALERTAEGTPRGGSARLVCFASSRARADRVRLRPPFAGLPAHPSTASIAGNKRYTNPRDEFAPLHR